MISASGHIAIIPHKNISLLLILFLAGFPSCKKKNTPAPDKPVDVYVAGITRPPSGNTIASYWKNGTLVALSTGATPSWAYSIAVAGSDVYVVGTIVTATG